jgi:hypothetical protein
MTPLGMKFGPMELPIRDTVETELHPDNMNMEGPLKKTDSHFNAHPSSVLFIRTGLPPPEFL